MIGSYMDSRRSCLRMTALLLAVSFIIFSGVDIDFKGEFRVSLKVVSEEWLFLLALAPIKNGYDFFSAWKLSAYDRRISEGISSRNFKSDASIVFGSFLASYSIFSYSIFNLYGDLKDECESLHCMVQNGYIFVIVIAAILIVRFITTEE